MIKTNELLNKAAKIKNDEFYTQMKDVEKMLKLAIRSGALKNTDKIICPCDTEESNFYKYFKVNDFNVDIAQKFEDVDYTKYDWVITNIPFSKTKEFFNCLHNKNPNIKILLITNWLLPRYKWFATNFIKDFYWEQQRLFFPNMNKHVGCLFISNIKECINVPNEKIEDGKVYALTAITKTNRKDFAQLSFIVDGKVTFDKLIYGKSTEWIKNNFSNIKRISYNLYKEENND